jgi:hypothetical protein
MKMNIKNTISILITIFLITSCLNNNPNGNRINPNESKEEIIEKIKGKWSSNEGVGELSIFYRFLITDKEIKIWENRVIIGFTKSEFKNQPDEVVNYSIGTITDDGFGGKELVIANTEKFGKLVITANRDGDGYFIMRTSNDTDESNSMFNDWEH